MFRNASLVSLIVVAGMPCHALAQQAEVLKFDNAPRGVIISVGPVRKTIEPELSAAGLSADELAREFAQLAPTNDEDTQENVTRTAIAVPRWMQTGRASHASAVFRPTNASSRQDCSAFDYQPRVDLAPSVERRRADMYPLIAATACEFGLPAGLFDALIGQESRYHSQARSTKGAIGLAQLMPATAKDLGVRNPWDVVENLRGGARYLREQLDEFGRVDLALSAYNAGPARVRAAGKVPLIRETIDYVAKITTAWTQASSRDFAPGTSTVRNPFRRAVVADFGLSPEADPS